jgi:hypothetical protein
MVQNIIGVRMDISLKTSPAECIARTSKVMGTLLGKHKRKKIKKDNALRKGNATPALFVTLPSPAPSNATKSNIGDSSKLLLSKSLQSALMTKADISEVQFKKIWDNACASLGN